MKLLLLGAGLVVAVLALYHYTDLLDGLLDGALSGLIYIP